MNNPITLWFWVVMVVVVCVGGGAFWGRMRRKAKTPPAPVPTQPRLTIVKSTPPADDVAPEQQPTPADKKPVLKAVPTPAAMATTVETAEPDSAEQDADVYNSNKVAWEELSKMLRGEGVGPGRSLLARDGRFNHRQGTHFTVVHDGKTCVIVRLDTRGARMVRRIVLSLRSFKIDFCEEPRKPNSDGRLRDGHIVAEQARDLSFAQGSQPFRGAALILVAVELSQAYRVGDI